MKEWEKILIRNRDRSQEIVEETEYNISNGCCYFHDQKELDEFNDIDDDTLKEL
ncbi:MAG: hypothetical protein ACFE8B_14585 [Candidatus Hermodarchaeota archaeon]